MKKVIKILVPDAVVIKQYKEEKTKSGIVLPDAATVGGTMERFEGTVIAIGSKVQLVNIGDYVCFGRHAHSIKKIDGEEFFYVHEESIHMIYTKKEDDYVIGNDEFEVNCHE
uniref:Co-chaperonin GroES n=1 Tax=uncultured virus TaxID=340016 RepID=A0A221S3L6_9VIRU|nr:co-chaperonin GroES [uncultured virus]